MQIAEFQQWAKNTDRNTQWDLLTTLQVLDQELSAAKREWDLRKDIS